MFEKLIELTDKYRELRVEIDELLCKIKYEHPNVYLKRRGVRVSYTYRKFSTKYFNFDFINGVFYLKFGERKIVFSPRRYGSTWAFTKEELE